MMFECKNCGKTVDETVIMKMESLGYTRDFCSEECYLADILKEDK